MSVFSLALILSIYSFLHYLSSLFYHYFEDKYRKFII
nr:MAG TPA: hypothetical protein [Caudoviricetes sp.]